MKDQEKALLKVLDDSDPEEVGIRIRRYREAKGWSQHDLAKATGIPRSTISKYEGGSVKRLVSIRDRLELIAEKLDIQVEDLLLDEWPLEKR